MSELLVAGIRDTLHAHEPGAAHAHVPEAPVLSGPQVHHLASVMGLLVHQPLAVLHVAGHAVGHAVAVLEVVAVVLQLNHLSTEVLPLVDLHPELATVLESQKKVARQENVRAVEVLVSNIQWTV